MYEISLFFDGLSEDKRNQENTRYVYEQYKIEIENNINYINRLNIRGLLQPIRLKVIDNYLLETLPFVSTTNFTDQEVVSLERQLNEQGYTLISRFWADGC